MKPIPPKPWEIALLVIFVIVATIIVNHMLHQLSDKETLRQRNLKEVQHELR